MEDKSTSLKDLMTHADFLAYSKKIEEGGLVPPTVLGLLEKHPEKCKFCQKEAKEKQKKN